MRRMVPFVCVIAVGVLCAGPTVWGRVLYVDDDAAAPGDGASWATAYRYLQDALAAAATADDPIEIRVAQGTYKPDRDADYPGGGDSYPWNCFFRLCDDMRLLGGYAGVDADDPNARDFEVYETVLSADLADNDAPVTDASLLKDDATRYENAEDVVSVAGDRVLVEGFTITGAINAGLVLQRETSDAIVRDCLFQGNRGDKGNVNPSGGALDSYGKDLLVVRCSFTGNAGYHGAITCWVRACFEDCLFTENHSWGNGGGAGRFWGGGDFSDCVFAENKTADSGGALYLGGNESILARCVFRGNVAERQGGGVLCDGAATITDCLFAANKAIIWGGGGLISFGAVSVRRCAFVAGDAATGGGGVRQSEGSLVLVDSVFAGNRAAEGGGAIRKVSGDTTVHNCTFYGNRTSRGAFFYNSTAFGLTEIRNCIVFNGDSELWNEGESTVLIAYTNLVEGESTVYDPERLVVWSKGNVTVDPCFVDPGYWDANGTPDDPNDDVFVEGDYHLKSQAGRWDPASGSWVQDEVTSPCIDAGDPNHPIGDESFPNGGIINMGAYGGTAEASQSYFGQPLCATVIAGDLNGDCTVDWVDLAILMRHWLETGR